MTSTLPAESVLPLAAADLACYAQLVYPGFELPWHLELLVDHLEAVERGEIKRLMIFKPPRHGGSLTSVRLFPSWYLGRNPGRSVIVATYGQDLGDDHGRAVRNFLADPMHTEVFPACKLSPSSERHQPLLHHCGRRRFFRWPSRPDYRSRGFPGDHRRPD